jgi:hypothetical protein
MNRLATNSGNCRSRSKPPFGRNGWRRFPGGLASCATWWCDGFGLALGEPPSEVVGVIAAIGQERLEGTRRLDQGLDQSDVVGVGRAEQRHPRSALLIARAMGLGRPTAS